MTSRRLYSPIKWEQKATKKNNKNGISTIFAGFVEFGPSNNILKVASLLPPLPPWKKVEGSVKIEKITGLGKFRRKTSWEHNLKYWRIFRKILKIFSTIFEAIIGKYFKKFIRRYTHVFTKNLQWYHNL